jgi:hypothetical protein
MAAPSLPTRQGERPRTTPTNPHTQLDQQPVDSALVEHSLHAMLPPDVAQAAVDAGWAELHPAARAGLGRCLQVLEDQAEDVVGESVELVRVEELDRVWNEQHAQVGHAEQACLLERFVGEWEGADSGCGDAAPFEPYQVVHTARHARPSVGEPFDREVAV